MSLAIESKPDPQASMLTCCAQLYARYSLIGARKIVADGGRCVKGIFGGFPVM